MTDMKCYKDSQVTPREGDVVDQYDHFYQGRVIDVINAYYIAVLWDRKGELARTESEMITQTVFLHRDERIHEGEPDTYVRDVNRAWSQAINQDDYMTESKRRLNIMIDYKQAVSMRATQAAEYDYKVALTGDQNEELASMIEALDNRVAELETQLWDIIR